MSNNTTQERLETARQICRELAANGVKVQLHGIRSDAFGTEYLLSPLGGRSRQDILQRARLIKHAIGRRGIRVRKDGDEDRVAVIVPHDFELMLVLRYLVPGLTPSVLVINLAAIDRALQAVQGRLHEPFLGLLLIAAVVMIDAFVAVWAPRLMRRSRALQEQHAQKR